MPTGTLLLVILASGPTATAAPAAAAPLAPPPPVVATAEVDVSGLTWTPVADGTALLRALARSPFWSVTWDREGAAVASYRTVYQAMPDDVVTLEPGRAPLHDWLVSWVAAGTPPRDRLPRGVHPRLQPAREGGDAGEPPVGDLALLIVEDCAVYLYGPGSRRYGTFSGSAAFEAEIRWLDRAGRPIHTERGPFRGWER